MHHATLKSAVAKYKPLHDEGKSEQEIKDEIAQDEKEYDEESINEIYSAIISDNEPPKPSHKSKMTKGQAQEIIDSFNGINGVDKPEEFYQAKAVLRG